MTLAALVISSAAFAGPVPAQPKAGTCSLTDITGAYACAGGFSGNDVGTPDTLLATGTKFAELGSFDTPFELIDTTDSDNGSQVSLIYGTGGKTGKLLLEDPTGLLNFSIFGISLKAGNFYSLYLFDGGLLPDVMNNLTETMTELSFSTIGTGLNSQGTALGLSHAALWGVAPSNFGDGCLGNDACNPPPVPEPATLALAAIGLGVIALQRRRRRV